MLVEAAPFVQVRTEPGRAPVPPEIDETQQRQYVYMVRDLGARRQPAVVLTLGGGAIFLALCYLLHRRDRAASQENSDAQNRQPTGRGDRLMGQYLPIVILMLLGIVFGVLSLLASKLLGPAAPVGRQGSAVRVRHRADRVSRRSVSR